MVTEAVTEAAVAAAVGSEAVAVEVSEEDSGAVAVAVAASAEEETTLVVTGEVAEADLVEVSGMLFLGFFLHLVDNITAGEAAALATKVAASTTTLQMGSADRQTDRALVGMEDLPVEDTVVPLLPDMGLLVEDMVEAEVGISSEKAPVGTTTAMRNGPAISMLLSTGSFVPKGDHLVLLSRLRKWWTSVSFFTLLPLGPSFSLRKCVRKL